MIILDTNVVSETMRQVSDPVVITWLDDQEPDTLFLTAISLAELLAGIAAMPISRRRTSYSETLNDLQSRVINPRVLPFDETAARVYASMTSQAKTKGRAISIADGQIAAIAQVHGFTVATRDTSPFAAAGVAFINPWDQ